MWNLITQKADQYYAPLIFIILGLGICLRLNFVDQPASYIFDEDMHAFTASLITQNNPEAYEWWHQPKVQVFENQADLFYRPPAIEWLHPPVSKLLQAISIQFFGNNALAWRFPSVWAGTGIIWLVIMISFLLTRSSAMSLFAGLLAVFEPLLFVQSRIASTDIFVTFFGLLTGWLYIKYLIATKQPQSTKYRYLTILAIGISLGLTIASKWSGVFLVLGLLGFEVWNLHRLNTKNKLCYRLRQFTFICLVASVTYILSFSQMFLQGKSFSYLIELHRQAYWYQTHTTFTHPYQSRPWHWLIGQKGVWYYFNPEATGQVKQIVAKPWPLVTIGGFLSLILFNIQKIIPSKKGQGMFNLSLRQSLIINLLTWIVLSFYLPWYFINRALFVYQLTPIMPHLIILFVFLYQALSQNFLKQKSK